MNPETMWAWLVTNWPALRIPAAVVLGLVLLLLLRRKTRGTKLSMIAGNIAAPLVLLWEAQGVFELALTMNMPRLMSFVVSGVGAAVLITIAARAHEHWKTYGNLGPNGRLLWRIAVPMGVVVALSAHSLAEAAARILLPLLAATVVMSRYLPDEPEGTPRKRQERGSWRWTPRRIGVSLGLIDPTDADLSQVHAERQIRRLTATAHKLHHGKVWRRMRENRLRRLALLATPEMIAEVHRRISLVNQIAELTAPAPVVLAPAVTAPKPSADAKPKPRTATSKTATTADRVAKAVVKMPSATPAQVAAKLAVSERTVQRYWPKASETLAELAPSPA
ncbi:hypothetical protein [Catelliglobosispora koreensis]|uniref:hypothetical protein n=1 Tax=Catelliglobosispora koreensis TaxID=129052 RepID=UPI00036009A1|nr:hypothetical protein [Catelliglobosispora koreensis]